MRAIGGGAMPDGRHRRVDVVRRPLQLGMNRPGVVVDEAAESELGGGPRDRRAETDALHHTGDVEAHPHVHRVTLASARRAQG